MMRIQTLIPASLLAVVTLGSNSAWALSCDEIINMVEVNVPTNIVVMTVKDSGEQFTADEIKCLQSCL